MGRINTEFRLYQAFDSEKKIIQNSYCAKEKSRKLVVLKKARRDRDIKQKQQECQIGKCLEEW